MTSGSQESFFACFDVAAVRPISCEPGTDRRISASTIKATFVVTCSTAWCSEAGNVGKLLNGCTCTVAAAIISALMAIMIKMEVTSYLIVKTSQELLRLSLGNNGWNEDSHNLPSLPSSHKSIQLSCQVRKLKKTMNCFPHYDLTSTLSLLLPS